MRWIDVQYRLTISGICTYQFISTSESIRYRLRDGNISSLCMYWCGWGYIVSTNLICADTALLFQQHCFYQSYLRSAVRPCFSNVICVLQKGLIFLAFVFLKVLV